MSSVTGFIDNICDRNHQAIVSYENVAKTYDTGLFFKCVCQEIKAKDPGHLAEKQIDVIKHFLGTCAETIDLSEEEKALFQKSVNATTLNNHLKKIVSIVVAALSIAVLNMDSESSTYTYEGSLIMRFYIICSIVAIASLCLKLRVKVLENNDHTIDSESPELLMQRNWSCSVKKGKPLHTLSLDTDYFYMLPNARQLKSYKNMLIEISKIIVGSTEQKTNKAALILIADDKVDHNGSNYSLSVLAKSSGFLDSLKFLAKDHKILITRFSSIKNLRKRISDFYTENKNITFRHLWFVAHASKNKLQLSKKFLLKKDSSELSSISKTLGGCLGKKVFLLIEGCEAGKNPENKKSNISQEIHKSIQSVWLKKYAKSNRSELEMSSVAYSLKGLVDQWYIFNREKIITGAVSVRKTEGGLLCHTRYSGKSNKVITEYKETVTINL
ncbi:MAG: hypothetical protein CMO81_09700 [Waddliaceae bacterium]|nr:hypothetical protein [Waddliaceae bacterium]